MNNVIIKIDKIHDEKITKKLINKNISFRKISNKNNVLFELSEEDYNLMKKLDYKNIITFIKYKGIKEYINILQRNTEKFIISISIIVIFFLSSFLIIKVDIKTNDIKLKYLIKYYLIDNKIDDYTIKKNYHSLTKIKKNLLDKYSDDIEWIEISHKGYKYDVELIKRKKNKISNTSTRCNYVASKSGIITSIIARKGVINVSENNYVNRGDILISGSIIYNEELKKEVCASGSVLGEVWYKVDISIPLKKETHKKIKMKQKDMIITFLGKDYKIFNTKYKVDKRKNNHRKLIDIRFDNTYKTKKTKTNLNEKEAVKKGLELSKDSISKKLSKKGYIIEQNILKKYLNNGTIYLEVLVTVIDELGVIENY